MSFAYAIEKYADQEKKYHLAVEKAGNTYQITYRKLSGNENELQPADSNMLRLDTAKCFTPRSKVYVYYRQKDHVLCEPVSAMQIRNTKGGFSYYAYLNLLAQEDYPICVIYFHDKAEDGLFFFNAPVEANFECDLYDPAKIDDVIVQSYPEYQFRMEEMSARQGILQKVDANDAISYLEPQVDILSKLLFAVIDHSPAKEQITDSFAQFQQFRNIIEQVSVLNIKSFAKCMEEIQSKGKIRQAQNEYYNTIQKIDGGISK
jgi:hypothetical protein